MTDTLSNKLSKAVKPAVDYAKNLYAQGKALAQPLDNEKSAIQQKQTNIDTYKKASPEMPAPSQQAKPNSYKKGGKVKKSGMAKVHKNERVLTVKQTKKFEKKGGLSKLSGGK